MIYFTLPVIETTQILLQLIIIRGKPATPSVRLRKRLKGSDRVWGDGKPPSHQLSSPSTVWIDEAKNGCTHAEVSATITALFGVNTSAPTLGRVTCLGTATLLVTVGGEPMSNIAICFLYISHPSCSFSLTVISGSSFVFAPSQDVLCQVYETLEEDWWHQALVILLCSCFTWEKNASNLNDKIKVNNMNKESCFSLWTTLAWWRGDAEYNTQGMILWIWAAWLKQCVSLEFGCSYSGTLGSLS